MNIWRVGALLISTLVLTTALARAEFEIDEGMPLHLLPEATQQDVKSLVDLGEWHFRTQNMEYAGCIKRKNVRVYKDAVTSTFMLCTNVRQQPRVWVSVSRIDGTITSSAGVPPHAIGFLWRDEQKALKRLKELANEEQKERAVELRSE